MAFSIKPNHTIKIPTNEILDFGNELSILSDGTVNLDEKLIKTGGLLGISRETLSKIKLSSDPIQQNNMELINNLNITLDNYPSDELPPQLIDYIDQIKIQLINTTSFNELPTYFNLLLSTPHISVSTNVSNEVSTHVSYNITDVNYGSDVDYDSDVDYESYNISDNDDELESVSDLNSLIITSDQIKNDVCVICFCQLHETVIQTKCNHQYHLTCIEQWYQIKNLCPLCKSVI